MKRIRFGNITDLAFLLFFVSLYFDSWKIPLFADFLLTSKMQTLFILFTILESIFTQRKCIALHSIRNIGYVSFFFLYGIFINAISSIKFGGDIVSSTFISNFLTFLCMARVFTSRPALMRTVAVVNIIIMDIICVFAILGIGLDFDTEFAAGESRLRIFGLNPNGLSLYAALSATCCIHAFFKVRKIVPRILLVASFLCGVQMIIFCGSKGGLVFLFVSVVVMLYDRVRKAGKFMIFLIPVAAVVIYYLFDYILNTDVFVSRFSEDDISDGRFALFSRGLKVFEQNPLFGVGISGYNYYMELFFDEVRPTHNGYLDVAAQFGLIGLFTILIYLIRQGRQIFGIKNIDGGKVTLVLYLIFILNFFKDGGVCYSKITWVLVALMIASTTIFMNQKRINAN